MPDGVLKVDLRSPPQANQTNNSVDEWIKRWELALDDPWLFVKDFVCTFDEHDFGDFAIEKPFPVKAMYRIICRVWVETDIFFMENPAS